MMSADAQWNVTMLFIHAFACFGFARLFEQAPCWMQKVVVALLSFGMLAFAFGDLATLAWGWDHWLTRVGQALEHIAVLLYVFRLNFQEPQWANSLARSRP